MNLRHMKNAPAIILPVTPAHTDNYLPFFLVFIATNAFKNVVAYTICDGSPSGLFIGLDFAEFTEVYQIEADFEARVEAEFDKMIEKTVDSVKTVDSE